jgi:uracil-DNA glycosylase family 4
VANCAGCPNGGQRCVGYGNPNADIMVVGEAPGRNEVESGRPFIGAAGQLFDATLADVGYARERTYVSNVVACRPTDGHGTDTAPTTEMVRACSERLDAEIRAIQPQLIIALGATSANRLLGTSSTIGKVQGMMQWSAEFGCFILPTYHPAAVLHGGVGFFDDIHSALQRAARMVKGDVPFPPKVFEFEWSFLRTPDTVNAKLEKLLWQANRQPVEYSLDTESVAPHDGPRPGEDRWIMFQMAVGPLDKPTVHTYSCIAEGADMGLLARLLRHRNVTWDLHNASYDAQVTHHHAGVAPLNVRDTMAMGVALHERQEQTGLEILSRTYLNAPYYKEQLKENGYKYAIGPRHDQDWEQLASYGAMDAYCTRGLAQVLPAYMDADDVTELYHETLLPAQKTFARVEQHGIKADLKRLRDLEDEWLPEIEKAERELQEYAKRVGFPATPEAVGQQQRPKVCDECVGPDWETTLWSIFLTKPRMEWRPELRETPFGDPSCKRCMKRRFYLVPDMTLNVRSYPQLQHLCFDVLHMPKFEGRRSTDAAFLEANEHHPCAILLLALREKDHLLRSYIRNTAQHVWADGRLHADFLIAGARNGRLAVHKPAVQTWPKWGVNPKLAKMVREPITTDPDMWVVQADYRQLELFTAAMVTMDWDLYRALTIPAPGETKADFHRTSAAAAFNKPYRSVTGLDRFNAKFIVFGISYGRQAWSLSQGELYALTGGDERKAQMYIDNFWSRFPVWHKGYEQWQRDAITKGELVTPYHRKRRWKLITPQLERAIRNQAANFVPASTASDVCLHAMIRLAKRLPEERLGWVLFTVHDALVFEIYRDKMERAVQVIREEMERELTWAPGMIPRVDIEYGPNLGAVHDWEDVG